jgi:phosphate transport system permease protein
VESTCLSNRRNAKRLERQNRRDVLAGYGYLLSALLCASFLLLIAIFLLKEGIAPFFKTYSINGEDFRVNFWEFVSATSWYQYPATSGIFYLFVNTLLVTGLASLLAIPFSILSALFIARIAPKKIGMVIADCFELLSAVPSVVYGLFGRGVITSGVAAVADFFGVQSAGGLSFLSASLVLALMITPTITSLSYLAMKAVPQSMIASSLALGASPTETNFKIVIRGAESGIFSGIILAVGRSLGEATAVSMVIGNAGSGPTFNLFGTSATLTSTMLLGYSEAVGVNAEIRFSIGLALILLIIVFDIAVGLLKRWRGLRNGSLS